jgi:hypothetical protein
VPIPSSADELAVGVIRADGSRAELTSDGLEVGATAFLIAPPGFGGTVVAELFSRLTSALVGPVPSIRFATLAACLEARAAVADA